MKRILILIALVLNYFAANAQFPGTDSLRNYNNKYITNNPATAFTNLRLNTLIRGIIDWVDTARAGTGGGGLIGVDTIWSVNDSTIRYRKNGVFRNFVHKGVYDTRRKVDTAYALNDSTLQIKINGTNRNIILPGRYWTLQGVLNNGSTLTENEVITLADSLKLTSGIVIIDSLRLPALTSRTDTTTYKPLSIDASGNVSKMVGWPITPGTDTTSLSNRIDLKLNISDTTNKWVNDIRRSNDSVYALKNGSWQFKYKDSIGSGSSLTPDFLFYKNITRSSKGVRLSQSAGLFLGDSYMAGTGASPFEGMETIISRRIPITSNNSALASHGYGTAVRQSFYNQDTIAGTKATFIFCGFNDVFRAAGSERLKRNIRYASRSLIANQFLASAVAANNAAVTYGGGTWATTFPADSAGLKCSTLGGGLPQSTFDAGATASWTVTAPSLVVGFASGDGVLYKMDSFSVTIDGNNAGTYSFDSSNYDVAAGAVYPVSRNKAGQAVLVFQNLSNVSHTIVITKGSNTSKQLVIDYFGTLAYPKNTAPLVIASVPHMTDDAKAEAFTTYGVTVTDAIIDTVNAIIADEIKGFSAFPVTMFETNDYLLNPSGFAADSIHPNSSGHMAIAQGFLNKIISDAANFYLSDGTIKETTGTRTVNSSGKNILFDSLLAMKYQLNGKGISFSDDGTNFNIVGINHSSNNLSVSGFQEFRVGAQIQMSTTTNTVTTPNAVVSTLLTPTAIANTKFNNASTVDVGFTISGGDTYKAGWAVGGSGAAQYYGIGINETNTRGAVSSAYGGSVYFDSRGGQAPIGFFVHGTGTTSSTYAGQVGGNGKWRLGTGTDVNPAVGLYLNYTDAIRLPLGTTAQRPTGAAGYHRANSDSTNIMEGYDGSAWQLYATRDWARTSFLTTAVTAINSQNGPSISISGDATNGITVSAATNTVTIASNTDLESFGTDANNTGTGETDLYSHTLAANKLTLNGKGVRFRITGTNNDATATAQIKGYFAGTEIFDSGALTMSAAGDWVIDMEVQRTTSTTAAATVTFSCTNTTVTLPVKYTALTSQDWTVTNIFKITGTAGGGGGGSNDITAHAGKVVFIP